MAKNKDKKKKDDKILDGGAQRLQSQSEQMAGSPAKKRSKQENQ